MTGWLSLLPAPKDYCQIAVEMNGEQQHETGTAIMAPGVPTGIFSVVNLFWTN